MVLEISLDDRGNDDEQPATLKAGLVSTPFPQLGSMFKLLLDGLIHCQIKRKVVQGTRHHSEGRREGDKDSKRSSHYPV